MTSFIYSSVNEHLTIVNSGTVSAVDVWCLLSADADPLGCPGMAGCIFVASF